MKSGIGRILADSNVGYLGSVGDLRGCVKIGDAGIDIVGGGPSGADIVGLVFSEVGEEGGEKVENLTWRGRDEEPGRDVVPAMGS